MLKGHIHLLADHRSLEPKEAFELLGHMYFIGLPARYWYWEYAC